MVLVLNRFDDIPLILFSMLGVLADCALVNSAREEQVMAEQALIAQLAHSEKLSGIALPEAEDPSDALQPCLRTAAIVLRDGVVEYNDQPILHQPSWTGRPR